MVIYQLHAEAQLSLGTEKVKRVTGSLQQPGATSDVIAVLERCTLTDLVLLTDKV